jgi:hypothetical protein
MQLGTELIKLVAFCVLLAVGIFIAAHPELEAVPGVLVALISAYAAYRKVLDLKSED